MSNLKKIGVSLLLIIVSVSCSDYLAQVPDDRLTPDQAFQNRGSVLDFLANVYSKIPNETGRNFNGTSGSWSAASDEAEYSYNYYFTNNLNIGAYDATTQQISDIWSNYYRGIRAATYFMQHVDECTQCEANLIVRYKAEARAVQAFYYFYLMRNFGPVVIFKDGSLPPDASFEDVQKPRTPFDQGIDYVVGQLDSAAVHLPSVPSDVGNDYYGHMTQSFIMAIKSEMLLYAASPLFNGNTDYASFTNPDGTSLISQQYDENKWKRAADASKAFIDKYVPDQFQLFRENDGDGNFSPYLSCRDVVLNNWNSEIIYAKPGASKDQYVTTPYHQGAPDGYRGGGGFAPTQTMVDAYFTANGRSIDNPKSGYQESGFSQFQAPFDVKARRTYNEWANREPRFYVGITYNESLWLQTDPQQVVTSTWFAGNSGKNAGGNDYPHTGYVVRKNNSGGQGNTQSNPIYRLAEIYLNYVEALNEYDPGNPDILTYLNKIRARAGIPGYGPGPNQIPAPQGKEAMRQAIHHERRVELAFEGKRYFDVRRWKVADQTEGGPFYGMDVLATPESSFYNKVVFEERVFNKRDYLFPIPQDDYNTDQSMVQNPGWGGR